MPETKSPRTPRRGRLRAALARAGLVLASLAFAAGVGEIVARAAFPRARSVSWYHFDPAYGFRHRENADAVTTEWGDTLPWHFRTNARGFRGPAWPDAVPAGTRRVLVTGDSFTFGDGLEEADAYPEVADASVDRASNKWEVLNLGVSAWGPQNALAYLETEGKPIEASCLVYGFFENNDVIDDMVRRLYAVKEGHLVKEPVVVAPPTRLMRVRAVMQALPLYDALIAHSQLFNVVRTGMINRMSRQNPSAVAHDPYTQTSHEDYAAALDLNDATLDAMATTARARYGGFALVMIPELGQLSSDPKVWKPFPPWMGDEAHARVLAWAKKNAVPVLDLRDYLPKDPEGLAKHYFVKDFHLNAAGNRVLGKALAAQLPALCPK
ncbi:MAG: SGNH/GDSL hydrolase family protein [Byssovorax sp.]